MIYTSSQLYLGSMPKTATTALTAALMQAWDGGYRYTMKCAKGQILTGHVKAWAIPEQIRRRRLSFGTTANPHLWMRRVYLHATDNRSPAMIESLQAYGQGRMDPRSVFYGMCHPWEIELPRQALLVQPVTETSAVVALQTNMEGLWSFAHRYYFGASCPEPGGMMDWGIDRLVDSGDLLAETQALVPEVSEIPRENVRRESLKTWLDEQYDRDEMDEWIAVADGSMIEQVAEFRGEG